MTRAGIALGSNIEDRLRHVAAARDMISELPKVQPPVLASAVYETAPVGCEPGAGNFLNAVLEVGFSDDALTLLRELRSIEHKLGRTVAHPRNASRTLDLDLLYFGTSHSSSAELQLPHPRMHERRFVLRPLADIRPDLVLPGRTRTVAELLHALADSSPVVPADVQW